MASLLEWHVYFFASIVTIGALITALTVFVRRRLRRARSQEESR